MGLIAVVQIIMVTIGGELLRTVPISMKSWIIVIGLAFIVVPIDLIRKMLMKKSA